MRLTGPLSEPELAFLPWELPLERWPADLVVALPRGISRHVVRFVALDGRHYAVKETQEPGAVTEYRLLTELRRKDLPCVRPVAIVADRSDAAGAPLPAALVTEHLRFSLPYRALYSTTLRHSTAERLLDALAVLLVRLHLAGFSWNDCSLSNTLFRRDAGAFAAYLVDAETGELHPQLSRGQRQADVAQAVDHVAGELLDLQAAGRLPESLDPVDTGLSLGGRYEDLWRLVTEPLTISRLDRYPLESRVRELNELGFDLAELRVETTGDGASVLVRPKVVEAGFHTRRLLNLTGLDVEENQARRMLNDLDSYRVRLGLDPEEEALAAHRWVVDRFERVMAQIPPELRDKLEPGEIFHEVLEHRWFLSERAGHSVDFGTTIEDYVATILQRKPEERAVLSSTAAETTGIIPVFRPDPPG